jgi:sulfatase modifying factor 1
MVRWVGVSVIGAVLAGALAAGCAFLVGIPQVENAPGEGGALTEDAGACGRIGAGGMARAGPDMVQIDSDLGSYCIDTTEVTVGQFNEYILDSGVMVDTPGECDAEVPTPFVDNDASDLDLPMGDLGECHAWSYCRWAGKRLCGAIGDGGSVIGVTLQDTEWGYACINGKLNLAYPYGKTYDPEACNTDNADGGPVPVRSKTGCHGTTPPFDRIYDMVGNVEEFVDDLQGNGSVVNALGGAWNTSGSRLEGYGGGCLYGDPFNGVIFDFPTSGFRCCADL